VIEAARALGGRKLVFASSETTYGLRRAQGERKPDDLPVDEARATLPEDSHAMSKLCSKATARLFQARRPLGFAPQVCWKEPPG